MQKHSDAEPVLKKGDVGAAVSQLQQLLNTQGATLLIDGIFGAATLTALLSFQQKNRISPKGVVDSRTWVALRKVAHS